MDHPENMWRNRSTIFANFTSRLSKEFSGEDLTIEWSSSDEEVIQPTCPPTSANETEAHASMNKDQHSEAYELSVPPVSHQNSSSVNEKGQFSPQKPNGEKTLLNTSYGQEQKHNIQGIEGLLPLSKHHDLSKNENEMETELSIPVSGRCHDDALPHICASAINVLEPQSPVLGSKKIVAGSCSPVVRARKVQIKTSSPLYGICKIPKKKLTLNDHVAVKWQISNDMSIAAAAARKKEQRNINTFHENYVSNDFPNSNGRTGNLNDVHEGELDECSKQTRVGQDELIQSPEENNYLHTPPRDCRIESTPSDCLVDHLSEEIIHFASHGSQGNSITSDTGLRPSVWSDLSLSQGHLEFCASQSIAVPSEGTDSQLDHNIEDSLTPGKYSVIGTDISEDSESSVLQKQVAATTGVLGMDGNTRSGFDWVKHLRTPQKLLSGDSNMDGMESAKKKLVRDGQAQQLKRVLMSWRSCITVWSHELSLTTLLGTSPRQSPSLPYKVQHYAISTSSVVKQEPEGRMNEVKPICSSSVKNLQDLLIENPASSPETNLWSCSRKISRKYLDLRLIYVGGQLPSNAALCEALGSNVKEFQTSAGIKKENAEAAETGKFKKFLVFFALDECNIKSLREVDTVRVYATWQNLNISAHDIPALFTSYFKFHLREEESTSFSVGCRRTVLHTWTCSCSDKLTVVSLCNTGPCAFPWVSSAEAGHTLLFGVHSGFTTIKDTPDTPPQNAKMRAGTILEALEKCGGVSAVPVSIIIRIHRIIIRREPSGSVEVRELVGQDAAGQFCIVKIPNWPLAQYLIEALTDSADGQPTHTLTHLMMTQRFTSSQNPGLFSLITSLHNAYQRSVQGDPLLQPVLQDLASCPPQTHCYVLTVSLGMTRVLSNGEQVTIPIELPHWSLQEALAVSDEGQRGNLTVYAVYKTSSSLHIVSPISHQNESPTIFDVGKETGEAKPQETLLISRVLLMGAALPPVWPESGSVMLSVLLKDAVVWHGSVVVDEYSFIQEQDEGNTKIDLTVLNQALSPLSRLTRQDSLTLVSGTIIKVQEENAFMYLICSNCASDRVQEAGDGQVDCSLCGQKSTLPGRGYFLEVWLDCGPELQHTYVKVKLYQKTIKKLLLAFFGPQEKKYSATSLLGHRMGPMPCVLLQVQRPRHCSPCTYNLAELPS